MKARLWGGAVVLGLGGWLSAAGAQEVVWRPAGRPTGPASGVVARGQAPAGPSVGVGTPLPSTPRGVAPDGPIARASAESAGPDDRVVHALHQVDPDSPYLGVVIASTEPLPPPPAPAEAEEAPAGDLFAMDRPEGPAGPRAPSSGVVRVAGWDPGQAMPLAGMRPPPPASAPLPASPLRMTPPPAALAGGPVPCGPLPSAPLACGPLGCGPLPCGQLPAGPAALPADGGEASEPGPLFYARAEYLLWWARRDHVPPLVTTGPNVPVNPGALGMPGTTVLFGDSLDRDPRSGGRFAVGYWLDDCTERAVEVGGFFLGERSAKFFASSDSFPVLSRPFFNLNQGVESVQRVASPGISTGSVSVEAPSDLWGLEANLRCKLCCGCGWRADLLGGFRYLDLRESITVTETIQGLATAPPPFTNAVGLGVDRFATRNQFYGGQVGLEGRWRWGRWSVEGFGKVALGTTHQDLNIAGSQQLNPPAVPPSGLPGNLLALNSNIGDFHRDRFAVVPEAGVSVGYHVTDRLRAFVGYDFLYWSSVVRPGEQIDRVLDIRRVPFFATPATPPAAEVRPAVLFKDTDFWAQGLTFGFELTF